MKVLLPLLALLTLLSTGFRAPEPARYTPLYLSEMVMLSELTVHGTIVEVKKKTFVLKVETILKGELKPADKKRKQLEVRRFQDWACASRWEEYKVGQEVLLFLAVNKRLGPMPGILSGGGEGEMPVVSPVGHEATDKWVVLRGRETKEAGVAKRWEPKGQERNCTAGELAATLKDLQEFHACFQSKVNSSKGTWRRDGFDVTRLVPKERVDKLAKRSKLARYLVDQARAFGPKPLAK
jgi:hypothetical protein